jgi:hypothetical protein
MRVAEEKYKLAVQKATAIYNATVKRAYDAHLLEMDDANNDVETVCARLRCSGKRERLIGSQVPYSYRSSRRDHHHRH